MRKYLYIILLMLAGVTFAHANSAIDKGYAFYEERNYPEAINFFQRYCKRHPKDIEAKLMQQVFYGYGMHNSFDINEMRQCMMALDSTSELANDFLIEYIEGCEVIPRADIIREDGPILSTRYSLPEEDHIGMLDMIARAYREDGQYKQAYKYYKQGFPLYLKRQAQLDAQPFSLERGIEWSIARLKEMKDSIRDEEFDNDYQICLAQVRAIGHNDEIKTYEKDVKSHSYVGTSKDSTISYYHLTPDQQISQTESKVEYLLGQTNQRPADSYCKRELLHAIEDLAYLYISLKQYSKADSCFNEAKNLVSNFYPIHGDQFIPYTEICTMQDLLGLAIGNLHEFSFAVDDLFLHPLGITDDNIVEYVKNAKYAFCDYHDCYSSIVPVLYNHEIVKAWLYMGRKQYDKALQMINNADSIRGVYLANNENRYLYWQDLYGNEQHIIKADISLNTKDTLSLRREVGIILSKVRDYYWNEYVKPHWADPYSTFWGTEVYTDYDRESFHKSTQKECTTILSYAYDTNDSILRKSAYDLVLFTKSLLLNTQNLLYKEIEERDVEYSQKIRNLRAAQMLVPHDYRFDSIQNLINETQAQWTKEKFDNKEITPLMLYTITDSVITNMSKYEVAIEFINFTKASGESQYYALLLRNNNRYPELIPLFEEKEVLSLINTANENQISFTYSFDGNGEQLSKLIWSKILPQIKQGETIYFAPSGLLHQVAIEALPYDEKHTMADMFNLVRLSSTREIVLNNPNDTHTTATLYGGIKYDMSEDEILAESEQYSSTTLLASRGIENDTLDRGNVKYLPGTKREVENINQMLKDNKLSVQLFTTTNANEESFKALSGKNQNILHIATHGFYWSDSTAQKKDYFLQRMLMMDDKMPAQPTIDPLNRCGLLFAGAQTAWSGHSSELPPGVQDGILTAKEISLLDLRDADLVVLSACETGKGEITGEGVFGLQRAFKQAGAQTIIMSLWPVDDKATQLLTTEFYRNWITNHQSKREAFKNAQNAVRNAVDEYGDRMFQAPVFWAGFIMLD